MALSIKKAGAYSAAAGVFVKRSGVYSAVQGLFVKVAGVYQSVMGYLSAKATFDGSYLSTTIPGGLDSSTGSASFFVLRNGANGAYKTIIKVGRCSIGIDSNGYLYGSMVDSTATRTFNFTGQTIVTSGHYALEWDTNFAAGAKVANAYFNGVSVPLTLSDASTAFVCQYQYGGTVGAAAAGANPVNSDIGELLFWCGTFANWAANIAKVYAAGNPVDPGANGSVPLGVVPTVYLSVRGADLANTFTTNRGSGPAFSLIGPALLLADESLLLYGDSLVEGTGASTGGTRWGYLLPRQLNRPIKAINYGAAGQGIAWIATKLTDTVIANVAAYKARIWILEGGYNTIANGATVIISEATRMVNALLAAEPSARYIFVGIPNGQNADEGIGGGRYQTIVDSNIGIAALTGSHFLDMRQWLIDNGLAAAGLTATANDLTDISQGRVPRQLQSDGLHYNDFGHIAWAAAIKTKLQALGYD